MDVAHPAAKTMIELSRSQDEETGDGSTSVVVLAGEVLSCSVDLLEKQQLHPSVISHGFMRALEDALAYLEEMAETVDIDKDESVLRIVDACVGTKFASRWRGLLSKMAVDAVRKVTCTLPSGQKVIDIKYAFSRGPEVCEAPSGEGGLLARCVRLRRRYAKVEKIPGGDIEESCVLDGLMLNKDVTHPKMKRLIRNPRVDNRCRRRRREV